MIRPQDDHFHKDIMTDSPYWNESAWFSFMIPERSLSGFVYMFHRPNMGYSCGGIALWDPSGDQAYDCLYYDFGNIYPFDPAWDMYDYTMPNGLSLKCIAPLQTFEIKYGGNGSVWDGADCTAELEWNAFLPPHQTGQPEGQQEWAPAKQHYEQPGRMKGHVIVRGERFDIDCWSMRDHSWGVRKLVTNTRGFFPWGIASETSGFQVYAMSDLPAAEDPIAGIPLRIAAGWYLKDGTYGGLSSGVCSTTERGPDGRPLVIEITATDSLGRELRARGKAKNALQVLLYPFMMQWWVQFEWELDGQICYGEEMDFIPTQHARQFLRSLK
jgi:hypothetical protein